MPLSPKMSTAIDALKPKEKKLRKGNSQKNKGKTGEYYFANYLSQVTGMSFQRIFTSGASVGQSNRKRLIQLTNGQAITQLGDITSPELLKQLIIWESKNYASVDLHLLLSPSGSKQIHGWLSELLYDVESALTTKFTNKDVWGFLLIKWTRKGSWIVFNKHLLDNHFMQVGSEFFKHDIPSLQFNYKVSKELKEHNWGDEFIMTDFEEFINKYYAHLFQLMTEKELEQQLKDNLQKELNRIKNTISI